MKGTSPVEEPVISLFPLLEEKKGTEKNKEEFESSRPVLKTIKEPELPDPVLSLLNNKGQCGSEIKWLLKELQANVMVNANSFLQAPINMINLTWKEKGKEKATWEVKAERLQVDRPTEVAIIKWVVLCNKCQCECELEVPAVRAILDQKLIKRREREKQESRRSIMGAAEKETF
ncbi:hypothetical protein ACFX1W_029966 [Malus domestica]